MSDGSLFGIPWMDEGMGNGVIKYIGELKQCRTCDNREKWSAGNSFFYYCGVIKSKFTDNGKLKIKLKTPACQFYKKEIK